MTLTYDTQTKKIEVEEESLNKYQVESALNNKTDSEIKKIIDGYVDECDEAANEVLANNVSGEFYSDEQLPNLMCKAIYDECIEEDIDIELSYVNTGRASLYSNSCKYEDIYRVFPLDNEVKIVDITGRDFINEVMNWNAVYYNPNSEKVYIDSSKTYKIAILDFVFDHTNLSRDYDYFPTSDHNQEIEVLDDNYRVILKDWLKDNGYNKGKLLKSSDYSNSVNGFNKNHYIV